MNTVMNLYQLYYRLFVKEGMRKGQGRENSGVHTAYLEGFGFIFRFRDWL